MERHAVRMSTRPAPERQPASSAASVERSGPSLMKGPVRKKPQRQANLDAAGEGAHAGSVRGEVGEEVGDDGRGRHGGSRACR